MPKLDMYEHQRPLMATMDLLQYRTAGPIGSIIRWKTGGNVNHSGIVMGFPDLNRERKWTLEATAKGLMLNHLSTKLAGYKGEVWWHPVRTGFIPEAMFAANWMMERVGTKYDYGGLFRNLFGKVSANAAAMFCSEAIFLGWQYAAIHMGIEILKHLTNTQKAPVPSEMPQLLKIYKKEGIRIL